MSHDYVYILLLVTIVNTTNDLQVYFSELKNTYTESTASYSVFSLLCDVGGALGLVLGSTVLTIFEIADLVLTLVATVVDTKVTSPRANSRHTATVVPVGNIKKTQQPVGLRT